MSAEPDLDDFFDKAVESDSAEDRGCRAIYRLKTCAYSSKRGVHYRRDLILMRRLSWDYNVLEDDCANLGELKAVERIVNLNECEDGLYEIVACNFSTDWETGYVDDWDLQLVPFKPEEEVVK